jgi:hypothetical protein
MKEIKLLNSVTIQPMPGQPICLEVAKANLETARKNGSKIIWATLVFEKQIEAIILRFFFEEDKIKMKFFHNQILSTDWFSLNAKRKFLLSLINEKKILIGQNKNDFEKYTRKIISYRNAFTHGNIVEKSNGTFMAYFEGQPREEELTNKYWDKVVETFKKGTELAEKIEEEIGKTANA